MPETGEGQWDTWALSLRSKRWAIISYWNPHILNKSIVFIIIHQGLVSKKAISFVIQRCVPGASDSDLRYAALMFDAALPKHTAINIEVRDGVVF